MTALQVSERRCPRVKNKSPAPIQITAEQILHDARQERDKQEADNRPPEWQITDQTELQDYRARKRKQFETVVCRVGRIEAGAWVNYALWEESHADFVRARLVWERALIAHRFNHTLYLKYAEFEIKNKFVNSARYIWDRAIAVFPRVDQVWYKYIHMEQMLGNFAGARQIFERWMEWEPDQEDWLSYVRFELRYKEIERARSIFERLVHCHNKPNAWIRYAKFEMKSGEIAKARSCYERAVENLAEDEAGEEIFLAFAEFEELCKETERARCIYRFALDRVPKNRAEYVYGKFITFEKKYGDEGLLENVILAKKGLEYEDVIKIRLEERVGIKEKIREVYERAIGNVPPASEKCYWQKYIYFWINYALFEEVDVQDIDRAREVYKKCLATIPHGNFSFSKIWLMAAKFEIRQLNLEGARRILGNAIWRAPKRKIFKEYIQLETDFGNTGRCRKLYEKYLEWSPQNSYAWMKYADLEILSQEIDRARAIFELAISQPALDKPEYIWKKYIDFELKNDRGRARELYERLLERTKHVKVWISYAMFEACSEKDDVDQKRILHARGVFERALDSFRTYASELKEERAKLLDEWEKMESGFGELGDVESVRAKQPRKIKRRRRIEAKNSLEAYEEYLDYLFPEEIQTGYLNLFEAAYNWKKQKVSD
ncbi:uncharacterized protein LOC130774970 [Actinidia eriantha]|uniref:uncharacterized protein LOC130774970 n=1 Tax=Actinidia eriantha TaxID=165200 RepID=UPI002590F549|nr:uncharacterized protein LOC130774970 [Actinidia eriantha]